MEKKLKAPHIYTPKNMTGLLGLYRKMPQSLLYGGGTGILWNQHRREIDLSGTIISLREVPELNFISRTESYLEIGAMAPLNRILGIGPHVVAPALHQALEQIGNAVSRNFATLGGNLARRESWGDLLPILLVLEVRVELRRQGTAVWIPLARLTERTPLFMEGELITRIRIPLEEWNCQLYQKFGARQYGMENRMALAALGKVQKGEIARFRFALGLGSGVIIRNRELENSVEGKKLPLPDRELLILDELLDQSLEKIHPPLTAVQKQLYRRSLHWFLQRTALSPVEAAPGNRRRLSL